MPHRDPLRVIESKRTRVRIPLIFLTNPFEMALGGVLVLNGIRGFLGEVSPSLAALPHWLTVSYLILSTLGGLGVIVGLSLRADHLVGLGVQLERASLYLVAASYFTLAMAILQANGAGGIGVALTLMVVTLACLGRAAGIRLATKTILHTLMVINAEAEK
jgi:hypothetical protein